MGLSFALSGVTTAQVFAVSLSWVGAEGERGQAGPRFSPTIFFAPSQFRKGHVSSKSLNDDPMAVTGGILVARQTILLLGCISEFESLLRNQPTEMDKTGEMAVWNGI